MFTQIRWLAVFVAIAGCAGAPAGDDAGWRPIFDGRSLDGWVTEGGRYDGDARWTVEDGALTGRSGPGSSGGLIYTQDEYRNFEVELDVLMTWPFDSGLFLRMRPEVKGAQVTLDHRLGGEIGGIYSDGWYLHNPAGASRYRKGDWNRVRVLCVGDPMHVVTWLNGELLTDYRMPSDGGPFARTGRIGLQVHPGGEEGGEVRFKNVRVRELGEAAGQYFDTGADGRQQLSDAGRRAGWTALLSGSDLSGWEPAEGSSGYRVDGGVLAFLREGDSAYLRTERDYRDFHLLLDFKIGRMANSGLFLRGDRQGGNPAYSGCEVQILDDFNWEQVTGSTLREWQFTGSLYGAVPPGDRSALRPLGEWNSFEVIYHGSRLYVALNGRVLYDVDTFELEADPLFRERAVTGFIGLQRHAPSEVEGDAYAWFRNVFLRELPPVGE